ncbi:protein of unknown function [Pararobbsia alpina]
MSVMAGTGRAEVAAVFMAVSWLTMAPYCSCRWTTSNSYIKWIDEYSEFNPYLLFFVSRRIGMPRQVFCQRYVPVARTHGCGLSGRVRECRAADDAAVLEASRVARFAENCSLGRSGRVTRAVASHRHRC